MTLSQARIQAVVKKIVGWIIFLIAVVSTIVSVLTFLSIHTEKIAGVNAVLSDFIRVIVDMVRFNTPFLNLFWHHSPIPDFVGETNIAFWIIYVLIFFGMAINAAGSRQWRQYRYVSENIENQQVIEQAKSELGESKENLVQRVSLPSYSPFRQYYLLYILPIITLVVGYFLLHWLMLI